MTIQHLNWLKILDSSVASRVAHPVQGADQRGAPAASLCTSSGLFPGDDLKAWGMEKPIHDN
jgi:hypothetical protein